MSKFNFKTVLLSSEKHEDILFIEIDQYWFFEDIKTMTEYLFSLIDDIKTTEVMTGADRKSVRFMWRKAHCIIHFECYSQSCWIEAQENNNECLLLNLETTIHKK